VPDTEIIPNYKSVQQLLQGQSFAIDEYQREYKWESRHVEELLQDLIGRFSGSYRPGDETKAVGGYDDYFLGSIIVSVRNNHAYLVDGQQRLTTLTLLLIALHKAAKAEGLPVAEALAPLIYSDNLGEKQFNLDVPQRIPLLRTLFNGDDVNVQGQDESIQTLAARYNDIEEEDLASRLGDAFPHFVYWLLTRVGLIEIKTTNDARAYAIFETMNDRGKPLSPVDMLKASLLSQIDGADQRANANRVWKATVQSLVEQAGEKDRERDATMMKAWLRAQYANSVRERKAGSSDRDWEQLGTSFHRWVRDHAKEAGLDGSGASEHMMTTRFPFYARAYELVVRASERMLPGLESVFYNAHNEFTWQNTVLLAPLDVQDDDDLMRRKIGVTATFLDIWIMRRSANYIRVAYSSTSYAMYLLTKAIRGLPLDELIEVLSGRLEHDDVGFEGTEKGDRHGTPELGLNMFSRRYIFHMLARLTDAVEVGGGQASVFEQLVDRSTKNAFDIEHLVPNNPSATTEEFASRREFEEWRDKGVSGTDVLIGLRRSREAQDGHESSPSRSAAIRWFAWVSKSCLPRSYRAVTRGSECRAATCMSRSGMPASSPSVTKVCRRLCGEMCLSIPAVLQRRTSISAAAWRDHGRSGSSPRGGRTTIGP
jgi:uncharacterized protein with ParB-like and HNH nuclease domain